ncbi:hypothetical protein AB833_03900 [Chromatiales bacterium (ex Bugula neritina AB1)]|nr:hypothetical protein AB833_03900 [Chromatiales bacterium (ex Bugula neritina AB1)]
MSNSWGNLYPEEECRHQLQWRHERLPETRASEETLLCVGNRRSYGDVCVNNGASIAETTSLSRFISFDEVNGVLRCEAGVTLWDAAQLVTSEGWFLPVTPGTSFVTIGGAVANDVHGKNHHVAGSFGCFVLRFELVRSNGDVLECSRSSNTGLFAATIGGLGLTGLITWVEFSLKRIYNPLLDVESIPYGSFGEFVELSNESERTHEYCVSWIDCLATGASRGRGVFFRANHIEEPGDLGSVLQRGDIGIPGVVGNCFPLVNGLTLRAFNSLYRHTHSRRKSSSEPFGKYFYPLDSLQNWNRIYGRRGFYQFQCVVPFDHASVITEILGLIGNSGQGSFLSVLKSMGHVTSPGIMSFSRPGVTLALDFPNRGDKTVKLLQTLEMLVVQAGGAIYPAKDAVMAADSFRSFFPRFTEFQLFVDPGFSSGFWRRVSS